MKGWIAAGAAVAASAYAVRKGLRTMPAPYPEIPGGEVPRAPLPTGLPEPVARYLEVVVGDSLPVTTSAVITGRMTMRIAGPALPGRFRFGHVVGEGYRHYMQIMPFGRAFAAGQEWYIDGHARLDLPVGLVENEPRIDRAANLSMWGEYLWLPSALVDPRARWEPMDAVSARLVVPQADGPDSLVAYFDPETGLLDRFEAMRWRDAGDPEPLRWVTRNHAWTRIEGIGVPAISSVQWGDHEPWLKLSLDHVAWNVDPDLRGSGA
ncbi:MAG TPA: hypothetical protein P5544_03805 [Candidatus Nanopelagicales bacterium]|nr:hypothetical protein [Candidatus Nanopelagicales bacterium]